ncbi:MAG: GTPase Era [Betaproteobacteria bacterium RIFCSPLOWO2_12_FULL_66_14]|nr:MAG: GTPase Era [Betaproteobacteria bacterium RIFCSPLOWO2_12_FULL_66_14]
MNATDFRCGEIAVVGRPNVGKSTLVNALVGERLSITSRKPQTTRHRIRGIATREDAQYIFVDTPGFQSQHRSALNRVMNRGVTRALREVDVVVLVVEAGRYGEADREVLARVPKEKPVVLAVNKIDRIARADLLRFLTELAREERFAEIVPLSAARGRNLAELLKALRGYLPAAPRRYAEDEFTDRSERFLAAERIREKLFRQLGDELPYGAAVLIDKFEQTGRLRRIHATIVVEKQGHKSIVIGSRGARLKEIASAARKELETLFGGKVHLEVWVKVRAGWSDDEAMLSRLGYD